MGGDALEPPTLLGRPTVMREFSFVDRNYRRKGDAAVALGGALDLIAKAGGGVVEAYPQNTMSKRTFGSFLYNGTRSLFEQARFSYDRSEGKDHCVMRRTVPRSSR
jgi:hypothetical protein